MFTEIELVIEDCVIGIIVYLGVSHGIECISFWKLHDHSRENNKRKEGEKMGGMGKLTGIVVIFNPKCYLF